MLNNIKKEKMEHLINGIRGFCMALADSVPGVSECQEMEILLIYQT